MWLARRHCAVQIAVSSVCGWRLDGGGTSDSGSSSEATLYLSGGVLGLLPRHAKSGGLPTLTSPPLFGLARSGASGRALSRPAPPKAGLIGRAVNLGCVRSVSSRCPTMSDPTIAKTPPTTAATIAPRKAVTAGPRRSAACRRRRDVVTDVIAEKAGSRAPITRQGD